MRKVVLLAALAITGLIAVAPAAQAQTHPFSASFKGIQTRNEPPCAAGVLCGSGSISGFGKRFLQRPAGESWARLGLLSGADRAGVQRPHKRTGLAHAVGGRRPVLARQVARHPGSLHSFGNPTRIDATYEVTDGTGVFEGAGGSGSATLRTAGAQNQLSLSGVLDL